MEKIFQIYDCADNFIICGEYETKERAIEALVAMYGK